MLCFLQELPTMTETHGATTGDETTTGTEETSSPTEMNKQSEKDADEPAPQMPSKSLPINDKPGDVPRTQAKPKSPHVLADVAVEKSKHDKPPAKRGSKKGSSKNNKNQVEQQKPPVKQKPLVEQKGPPAKKRRTVVDDSSDEEGAHINSLPSNENYFGQEVPPGEDDDLFQDGNDIAEEIPGASAEPAKKRPGSNYQKATFFRTK